MKIALNTPGPGFVLLTVNDGKHHESVPIDRTYFENDDVVSVKASLAVADKRLRAKSALSTRAIQISEYSLPYIVRNMSPDDIWKFTYALLEFTPVVEYIDDPVFFVMPSHDNPVRFDRHNQIKILSDLRNQFNFELPEANSWFAVTTKTGE